MQEQRALPLGVGTISSSVSGTEQSQGTAVFGRGAAQKMQPRQQQVQ